MGVFFRYVSVQKGVWFEWKEGRETWGPQWCAQRGGDSAAAASMAEHLASIFGTEKDRVNCPFYFKIGVCRHGDRCSRLHNRPTASQTLLLANMYQSPDAGFHGGVDQHGNIQQSDPRKLQEHFEVSLCVLLVRTCPTECHGVSSAFFMLQLCFYVC